MQTKSAQSKPVSQIWKAVEQLYFNSKRHEAHWLWQNHVQVVANNIARLADEYGGNKDLAVIGALLHDNADVELDRDDIAFEARTRSFIEKFMKEAGYSIADFNFVKDEVVDPHSCHSNNLPKTIEGNFLATADAMAHLKTNFYHEIQHEFFEGKKTDQQYREWVAKKLNRDFNDKIFFNEIKTEVEPFYKKLLNDFDLNSY